MSQVTDQSGAIVAQRFVLERVAGRGGMGTVYRAFDIQGGRYVALKLLSAAGDQASTLKRFIREAELLASLRHPGIAAHIAHGFSETAQPYLAMEWLEGHDLAQRLRDQGLSLAETLTLARHTAAALAVAHDRGIVHRDRTHKHKICSRISDNAADQQRTDHACIPLPHYPD